MFKFLVIAVALFIMYKLLTNDWKKKKEAKQKEHEKLAATGTMVKDPICGTFVDKNSDVRIKHEDQVHCFCSYDCRDKYLKKLNSEKK